MHEAEIVSGSPFPLPSRMRSRNGTPVVVVDHVSRFAVPGCGFDKLPRDPGCGGMGRDLEVEQLTPSVADEEDDEEGLKSKGLDHEEVGYPDRLSMVGEGAPGLAGWA